MAQISVAGQKRFAVRVKARPDALAARNLTLDDVANAVKTANANTPVGTLDGQRQTLTILANRQLTRAADFKPLIVATLANGSVVRLQDVADVEDSVESVKTASWSNGEPSIALFIQRQPGANTVAAIDSIKAALPGVFSQMPKSVNLQIQLDRSISIRAAIHDVKITLGITAALVVLVIYLFLRRPSATIIPALSLPISLLGTLALMRALGLSIDNVSLLGFTLAVGLVVDDAIVMLENIVRHIEEGMDPFAGGDRRLAADGLHDRLHLDLAGRGVHPDLLHAGRDRRALPRVRHRGVALDPRLGGRLAHARADAREPLHQATNARTTRCSLDRLVRALLPVDAAQLRARSSTGASSTASSCSWSPRARSRRPSCSPC